MDLEAYLSDGVEAIIKEVLKASLSNPKESLFVTGFAKSAKRATGMRKQHAKNGIHIPPFLIASITSQCNLHCSGCYARENQSCTDECATNQLTDNEWKRLFEEAAQLGISFVLLAGGEPLVRKEVLMQAASVKEIAFPVFTNATLLDDAYCDFFSQNRNVIPVLSMEGNREKTDHRRGDGVYDKLMQAMGRLHTAKVLFGASITLTTKNISEVTSADFVNALYQQGCRILIYVEYVPVDAGSSNLAPDETDRDLIRRQLSMLRAQMDKMLLISFPGDEKSSGGCLAAGRGFFHINSHGGAEPCPFSPFSDTNIRTMSLLDAIQSPLFQTLRTSSCLDDSHKGGCVLFEKQEEVKRLIANKG